MVTQGPKIRLGQFGRRHPPRGRQDHRQRRRGLRHRAAAQRRRRRAGARRHSTQKVKELNDQHSAQGREDRSLHRPQRPGPLHHPHRAAQPDRRHDPGRRSFCFSSSATCAARSSSRSPFPSRCCSRPSVSTCSHIPGQPALARRAGFRHGGGRRRGHGGKHRPPPRPQQRDTTGQRARTHPRRRARSAAPGLLRHRHHHHRLPADLHPAARRRPSVQAHGLDRGLRPARARCSSRIIIAPVLASFLFRKGAKEWRQPGHGISHRALPPRRHLGHRSSLHHGWHWRWCGSLHGRLPVAQRRDRLGVSAAPRRGRALGARHSGAQHRPHRRHPRRQPGARAALLLSRSHRVHQPGRPPRRRHGHHRLLQHRVLCRI